MKVVMGGSLMNDRVVARRMNGHVAVRQTNVRVAVRRMNDRVVVRQIRFDFVPGQLSEFWKRRTVSCRNLPLPPSHRSAGHRLPRRSGHARHLRSGL